MGLRGYKKDTNIPGNWTATELRKVPTGGKALISYSIDKSFKELAQPIQSLISMNADLGNPQGGNRTVCETHMTYRKTLRSRSEVADRVTNVQILVDTMHKKYKNEYERQDTYIDVDNDSAFEDGPNQTDEYMSNIGSSVGSESEPD